MRKGRETAKVTGVKREKDGEGEKERIQKGERKG
jgi:hypothetical protein